MSNASLCAYLKVCRSKANNSSSQRTSKASPLSLSIAEENDTVYVISVL